MLEDVGPGFLGALVADGRAERFAGAREAVARGALACVARGDAEFAEGEVEEGTQGCEAAGCDGEALFHGGPDGDVGCCPWVS